MSEGRRRRGVSIRNMVVFSALVTAALCVAALLVTLQISTTGIELERATAEYIECERAATEMRNGSDYLANQARAFVMTENRRYLDEYYTESFVTRRREEAVETLETYIGEGRAHRYLEQALEASYELQQDEMRALKLICLGRGIAQRDAREMLDDVELTEEEQELNLPAKRELARDILLSEDYEEAKADIDEDVSRCIETLISETGRREQQINGHLDLLLRLQAGFTLALLVTAVSTLAMMALLVMRPLGVYTHDIAEGSDLQARGCAELRYLAEAYNELSEEKRTYQAELLFDLDHDPLTGLLNRNAFERLCFAEEGPAALALVDVDYFKSVNDDYGHDVGDEVLCRVARELGAAFGEMGHVCRIGGDEFAVIFDGADPTGRAALVERGEALHEALARPERNLPAVTLSAGIAFAEDADEATSLYKAADTALYAVKARGRNGWAFFGD